MRKYGIFLGSTITALVVGIAIYLVSAPSAEPSPATASVQGQAQVLSVVDPSEKARLEEVTQMSLTGASEPPRIAPDVAESIATKNLIAGERALVAPKLSPWLITNPGEAVARAAAGEEPAKEYLDLNMRPVWIVTYDKVETVRSGPAGGTAPEHWTAQVDMVIDSTTGEWLFTTEREVSP